MGGSLFWSTLLNRSKRHKGIGMNICHMNEYFIIYMNQLKSTQEYTIISYACSQLGKKSPHLRDQRLDEVDISGGDLIQRLQCGKHHLGTQPHDVLVHQMCHFAQAWVLQQSLAIHGQGFPIPVEATQPLKNQAGLKPRLHLWRHGHQVFEGCVHNHLRLFSIFKLHQLLLLIFCLLLNNVTEHARG